MPSPSDFPDGASVGRDSEAPAPAARRTSSAFGSPGADSTVKRIDLNDALIRHPDATFTMRAAGNAMASAGVGDGDVLLVDRAVPVAHNAVVIAVVAGELLCRRLEIVGSRGSAPRSIRLVAEDGVTPPIAITLEAPLEVWGVVTTVIKTLSF